MNTVELRKAIEEMVYYGERPYLYQSAPEFKLVGSSYVSGRTGVTVKVEDAETTFFYRGMKTMIPTVEIKAIRYGFGCAFAIEKTDGEIVLIG